MRSLTFLFLVISTAVLAQPTSYGNFKVWEQEIIYQRIVPLDSITPEKLGEYYTAQPFVSNLTSNANGVEFDVNDIVVDYKKISVHASRNTQHYPDRKI